MRRGLVGGITLGIVIVVGGFIVGNCITRVPAGYEAVQYDVNGGIKEETLSQGWKITPPTINTTIYTIGLEQSYLTAAEKGDSPKDESFKTPTADGKTLTVDLEFSYRFDRERLAEIFTRFKGQSGEEVKNSFIKPKMVAWTQEVTAKYPVTDVFGDKRQELNEALDVYLKQKFEPYGIIIDTVNFTNISTDPDTEAAIQKKVTAQQEQELANIEAKTAKINAEKEREVALIAAEKEKEAAIIAAEKDRETAVIQAEQARITAEGKADAKRIAAEAEAEANKMIAESLTDELIEMSKVEQWSGNYPYIVGSDTASIIDIGNLVPEE